MFILFEVGFCVDDRGVGMLFVLGLFMFIVELVMPKELFGLLVLDGADVDAFMLVLLTLEVFMFGDSKLSAIEGTECIPAVGFRPGGPFPIWPLLRGKKFF